MIEVQESYQLGAQYVTWAPKLQDKRVTQRAGRLEFRKHESPNGEPKWAPDIRSASQLGAQYVTWAPKLHDNRVTQRAGRLEFRRNESPDSEPRWAPDIRSASQLGAQAARLVRDPVTLLAQ